MMREIRRLIEVTKAEDSKASLIDDAKSVATKIMFNSYSEYLQSQKDAA